MYVLRTMFSSAPPGEHITGPTSGNNAGGVPSTAPDRDEHMMVWIEDPSAPTRSQRRIVTGDDSHTRWTFASVATQQPAALGSSSASSSSAPSAPNANTGQPAPPPPPPAQAQTPFDAFLQRVLLAPPSQASSSSATSNEGLWMPRASAISLEGFVFQVGADRAAGSGVGDWQVKVGSVVVKGGAASGSARGVLVEATYLAVPYLPPGSTYVRDFLSSLFPPQAILNGEIEFIEPNDASMHEAGVLNDDELASGGDWDWQEKHLAWMYVDMFKREGLL